MPKLGTNASQTIGRAPCFAGLSARIYRSVRTNRCIASLPWDNTGTTVQRLLAVVLSCPHFTKGARNGKDFRVFFCKDLPVLFTCYRLVTLLLTGWSMVRIRPGEPLSDSAF